MRTLAVLLLVGCGPAQVVPPMMMMMPVDAGMPDVPDAGSPCDGEQPCRIAWKTAPDFPADTDHHSSFVATSAAGTFLYVAGGVKNGAPPQLYDTVRRAPIAADGSLGVWVDCAKLPRPTGFQALAQSGRFVYLLAGVGSDAQGAFAQDRTLIGTVQDDGDVTWVESPHRLGNAFLHGTGAVLGDTLYLIGGTANGPQSIVKVSKIGADGSLSGWTNGVSLPLQRSHHVAFVRGGAIWLVGGFDTGMAPIVDVLRSELDANGMLTGWARAGDIESAPWTSAAVVYQEHVFLIGGGEGGPGNERYVNRVRRARFYPNQTLSPFIDVDTLPAERAHVHQAPSFGKHVYSVGGRQETGLMSFSKTFVGTIGE